MTIEIIILRKIRFWNDNAARPFSFIINFVNKLRAENLIANFSGKWFYTFKINLICYRTTDEGLSIHG
ncbi:hypothetical protein IV02_04515 [Pseudomonas syringae]|uniref:Uncharacterized protein n=1 Tax=Pseudomonas syringae TaxID=317 RepID=A0A085VF02_PSESX|nr:hypothetical protein IV02_04515 [Pseudomonas syringae]